jgi:phosphate/sulfate permease
MLICAITFEDVRKYAELASFLASPLIAYFAWRMLEQLRIGYEQVKAATSQMVTTQKIAQTQAQREALRIAADQTCAFAENVIPMLDQFHKFKREGKYPILLSAKVEGTWPQMQCHIADQEAFRKEVESNDALVIRILNRIEGIAMYFAIGVADADKAYAPLCNTFCSQVKLLMPYVVLANERQKHYTYTLMLYGSWGMRDHVEQTTKELNQKKEHLSKITIPTLPTVGT